MTRNKVSLITLSAALGGLVICLASPVAHGHGNNPKYILKVSEGPHNGFEPHPGPGGIGDFNDEVLPLDPSGISAGDFQIGLIPTVMGPPKDRREPVIAFGRGTSVNDLFDSSFNDPPAPVVPTRASSVIPAPGTLALLWLGALGLARRRRRH